MDNPETLATLGPERRQTKQSIMESGDTGNITTQMNEDKPKGQSIMDNPETLATLGPQDTERRQTKGAINNGQSGDTGNIRTTRH